LETIQEENRTIGAEKKERGKPLIVDIGANLGHLSLIAASLGFRSIAYEPNPDFAEKFRMSVHSMAITIQ